MMKTEFKVKYIPGGFNGMTIWPFIFYKTTIGGVLNHERIHIAQANELYVIPFIILYIWYYIRNIFDGMYHYKAYKNIPFEKEAYANQRNPNYLKTRPKNNWKKYR